MTLSGVHEDVDISHQHDILTPTSSFDIMDTNASDSKSVHDDSNNSVSDDNCSGKDTYSGNENTDLDVCEEIEEARV